MFKLTRFLKGYRLKTVFGPFFKLIEAVFELITPLVVAWVIDTAIPMGQAGDYSGLIYGGLIILGLGVLGLAFALTAQFFACAVSSALKISSSEAFLSPPSLFSLPGPLKRKAFFGPPPKIFRSSALF